MSAPKATLIAQAADQVSKEIDALAPKVAERLFGSKPLPDSQNVGRSGYIALVQRHLGQPAWLQGAANANPEAFLEAAKALGFGEPQPGTVVTAVDDGGMEQ